MNRIAGQGAGLTLEILDESRAPGHPRGQRHGRRTWPEPLVLAHLLRLGAAALAAAATAGGAPLDGSGERRGRSGSGDRGGGRAENSGARGSHGVHHGRGARSDSPRRARLSRAGGHEVGFHFHRHARAEDAPGDILLVGETLAKGRYKSAQNTIGEYARLLSFEAGQLTRLIDNLLTYSRITDAARIYTFEPAEVADLVEEALERLHARLDELHFEVTLDLPGDLPRVRVDRVAMLQVMDNLIDNAIKYGSAGRVLMVRAWVEGGRMQVEVADRGAGIPESDLARVFEKFFRGRMPDRAAAGSACPLPGKSSATMAATSRCRASPEKARRSRSPCPWPRTHDVDRETRARRGRRRVARARAARQPRLRRVPGALGVRRKGSPAGVEGVPAGSIVLDIMLPGLDGFEVCRALEGDRIRTPIIMLTARTGHDDKVRGLELGADDYVTKPFAFDELLARINAVLRRSHPRLDRIVLGDITVDFRRYRASRGGRDLALTHREVELLHYLAERAGRVVTREELLRLVWRYSDVPATRTVDNFIARLRRKIEPDPHHPQFIRTVHGDGYSLTIPA